MRPLSEPNNSTQMITLPKMSGNQDLSSAQDTIYLCNFRVSVDGEWLCLKELHDLDIQDASKANAGTQHAQNRKSFAGTSGCDGINASSVSSSKPRKLTGFDSIVVGTQDRHTDSSTRSADWVNFYCRCLFDLTIPKHSNSLVITYHSYQKYLSVLSCVVNTIGQD